MLISITSGVFCLALAVAKETSGESVRNKEALALITMNRKDDLEESKKRANVCDVIAQKGQYTWEKPYRKGYKFKIEENPIVLNDWKETLDIAKRVYSGKVKDFTGGARFVNHKRLGRRFKTKVKPLIIETLMYY